MIKKLLPLFILGLVFAVSCNQGVKEVAEETAADTIYLAVATFEADAPDNVDKHVWIEGTVYHTCKHGGKRMFIVDENDSVMVEVTAGSDVVTFEESFEGSRVNVFGILVEERVDEQYLNEWEAEVMKPEEEDHEAGLHEGTIGHEDHSKEDKLAQINNLREQLKKSGKEFLAFYSIEAIAFEEIPTEAGDVEEETVIVE